MISRERRANPRSSLSMPARLQRLSCSQRATICDLSTAGCKLYATDFSLAADNRVLIRTKGLDSLLGTVVWSRDGEAGVKFDEALEQSVVDHFCRLFPDRETAALLDIAA